MTEKELIGCVLCGGSLSQLIREVYDNRFGIKDAYEIVQCKKCSLVQLANPPSLDRLNDAYRRFYNFGGTVGGLYSRIRLHFLQSLSYKFWLYIDGDPSFHSQVGRGRLLDVGCNEGRGLTIYRRNGFDVEGLELNEKAANEARQFGFKVYTERLDRWHPKKKYDAVVLSNVLEHSLQPKEMLANVFRVLKPGGQVWVSCPNVESWQRKLFGRNWINWHVPFHIVHFSRSTLANALRSAGFRIQEKKQVSPALWLTYSMLACLFARPGRPTGQLRNPILIAFLILWVRCLLFPVLWLGNRLGHGDCLIAVAEKRKI